MKPVDFQPGIFQTPNVERIQQELVSKPQINQQVIAAETQKIGSEKTGQVQAPPAQSGPREPEMLSEDRGERARRRAGKGNPDGAKAEEREESKTRTESPEGAAVDILV